MVWWQMIAIAFGSLAGGALAGLLTLCIILRIQKKPWPFHPNRKRVVVNQAPISRVYNNTVGPPRERREPSITAAKLNPTTSTEDSLREALSKLKSARMAEWPAIKKSGAEQPAIKKSSAEQPVIKISNAEQPVIKISNAEQPVIKISSTEQPAIKTSGTEQPAAKNPDALLEAEANLKTATTPWADKLVPFQTTIWSSKQSEFDTVPVQLQQELVRAYADMRLANDIVWLATILDRQSEELNSSYRKLCVKVAERLVNIIPALKNSGGMAE